MNEYEKRSKQRKYYYESPYHEYKRNKYGDWGDCTWDYDEPPEPKPENPIITKFKEEFDEAMKAILDKLKA